MILKNIKKKTYKQLLAYDYLYPHSKGQKISEWIYEVVALPKIWTKN